MPESDGRVEFEVRADLSKIDADMAEAGKKVSEAAQKGAKKQEEVVENITQQKNTMILNLRKMIINVLHHSFRKSKENFCFLIMMIHLFESYTSVL